MNSYVPEARCVNPGPAQLDNASCSIFFYCTSRWRRAGGAWFCLVRKQKAVVACELFKTNGKKKREGDYYKDLAGKGIAKPTPKLTSV